MPIFGPTQDLNEFGHQTHVGSRPVIVFGAFHGENHKKFIRCQKIMKTCTHDGPGDAGVWKKFGVHRLSQKRKRSTELTSFISDLSVAWVVRRGMHETSPNFGRQWACPS